MNPTTPTTSSNGTIREWIHDNYIDNEPSITARTHLLYAMNAMGCDEAIIGVATGVGHPTAIVYDPSKIAQMLMIRDGMTMAEACDYVINNVEKSDMHGRLVFLQSPVEVTK